jgi:hypothetical protein
MLSIIGIKKTIKQHTADMDITDSVDYKISAPPRLLYNPYRPNTVIYYYCFVSFIKSCGCSAYIYSAFFKIQICTVGGQIKLGHL